MWAFEGRVRCRPARLAAEPQEVPGRGREDAGAGEEGGRSPAAARRGERERRQAAGGEGTARGQERAIPAAGRLAAVPDRQRAGGDLGAQGPDDGEAEGPGAVHLRVGETERRREEGAGCGRGSVQGPEG